MKAMNTIGGVLIGQKEETKPTTYLKMETHWKDYGARLLIRCLYVQVSWQSGTSRFISQPF